MIYKPSANYKFINDNFSKVTMSLYDSEIETVFKFFSELGIDFAYTYGIFGEPFEQILMLENLLSEIALLMMPIIL